MFDYCENSNHKPNGIASIVGTHGEPGHGLTGTTPYNTHHRSAEEKIGYVYLSEVSHNYGSSSYCYVCELNDDNNSDNSKKDE